MSMSTENPDFKPLKDWIGERVGEWMWMYRKDGLEHYKHHATRQYLILDKFGRAWTRCGPMMVETDFETEYRRATAGYSTEHD